MELEEKQVINEADHVAQFVANLVTNTVEWNEHAIEMLRQGKDKEAAAALAQVNENLAELEKHHALTVQVVAGLQGALITAIAQRDRAVEGYNQVQETFNQQVHVALSDTLEHILTCGECMDDVEIETLANAMMEEDPEVVAQQAREIVEEQIAEAYKLAQEWRAESPEPPGIAAGLSFRPNPNFMTDPLNAIGDDYEDDDDLDTDDDLDENEEG